MAGRPPSAEKKKGFYGADPLSDKTKQQILRNLKLLTQEEDVHDEDSLSAATVMEAMSEVGMTAQVFAAALAECFVNDRANRLSWGKLIEGLIKHSDGDTVNFKVGELSDEELAAAINSEVDRRLKVVTGTGAPDAETDDAERASRQAELDEYGHVAG